MSFELAGRIVRVDLAANRITEESLPNDDLRRYLGGSALIARLLLQETQPGLDPLSPDNPLIFSPGVLTGTSIPGSGRSAVGAKSPLTGGFGCSEGGGFFPAELRRAGLSALVIVGRAESPVVIVINGDKVEIQPAGDAWGQAVHTADRMLRERLGKGFRVACIGPAGEKLVRFASVHHDVTHVCGRTGMGAVMGSKQLKAVAIRGGARVPLADPDAIKALVSKMMENWDKSSAGLRDAGTAGLVMGLNTDGGLPTRAFQKGSFERAEDISGQRMRDTVLTDRESCWACPIRCKRVVTVSGKFAADPELGGPEYETIASLGSLCEVGDLEAICCGNALCNELGLDTISAGVAVAFAMECHERGLLAGIPGAPAFGFGDAEGMVELVRMIGERRGFGDVLAEGVARAARSIGGEATELAMVVRDQELPMHEPRYKLGLGLGYAVSPTGADHCHNLHDTMYGKPGKAVDGLAPFGILGPVARDSLGPEKVRLFRYVAAWRHFNNCAMLCNFLPWSVTEVVDLVRGVTGWDTSLLELFKVADRAINLGRLYNIREGLGGEHDELPERMFEPLENGALAGQSIDREQFQRAMAMLYEMSGWDAEGKPRPETLHDLDLGWAID